MIFSTLATAAALASAHPPPTSLHELEGRHAAGHGREALRDALRRAYPVGVPIADVARGLTARGGVCSPLKGADQSCGLMHHEMHHGEPRQVIWTVRLKGDPDGALKTLLVTRNTWTSPPSA